MSPTQQSERSELDEVARGIADADYLLIVAAAGLSISHDLPNNPYHNPADFLQHYPRVASYGYRTAFDAMGLSQDARVPKMVRVAHSAKHFLNMRFNFPPTPGYEMLHDLASSFPREKVFCWTSNVDGCFERAGFDRSLVYTSQGEMNKMQCARPGCGHVWNCEEQCRAIVAASPEGELTDPSLVPRCSKCGSEATLPNLRGGDWFIHQPYDETSLRLQSWLDKCLAQRATVAVVEVGVGGNTPIVTRIPACAFASAVQANSGRTMYLRINPDCPEGPRENPAEGVAFYRWRQSWTALEPLVKAVLKLRQFEEKGTPDLAPSADQPSELQPAIDVDARAWQEYYQSMLASLRRPSSLLE